MVPRQWKLNTIIVLTGEIFGKWLEKTISIEPCGWILLTLLEEGEKHIYTCIFPVSFHMMIYATCRLCQQKAIAR